MNVWGTIVIGTVLAATEFRDLCAHNIMLPPQTQKKVTDDLKPSTHVMDLAVTT